MPGDRSWCDALTAIFSASVDGTASIAGQRDPYGQLRLRAARHGRSMEEEARTILREAVTMPIKPIDGLGLGSRIGAHFADLGGLDLLGHQFVMC